MSAIKKEQIHTWCCRKLTRHLSILHSVRFVQLLECVVKPDHCQFTLQLFSEPLKQTKTIRIYKNESQSTCNEEQSDQQ